MQVAASAAPSGAAPSGQQAGSSGRQPTSGGQQQTGQGGQGGDFDFKSAFTSQTKKLEMTERQLGEMRKQMEGLDGDRQTMAKLRQLFSPEQDTQQKAPDRIKHWESQVDHYLSMALEAEKAGRPLPLTTNLAIESFQNMIETHKALEELRSHNQKMQQELERLRDPGHAINQRAFAQFDTMIQNGLEQIYGAAPTSFPQRQALFKAVGDLVGPAVNALIKNDPKRWDMIRRDPQKLQDIANRALRQVLPPKAVQMIEQEHLRNSPMNVNELRQAMKEAKEQIKDPTERERIVAGIRQQMWAQMQGSQAG